MKKLLTLLVFMFWVISRAQTITYSKAYGDSTNSYGNISADGMVAAVDNGVVFIAQNYIGGLIFKTDTLGKPVWNTVVLYDTTISPSINLNSIAATKDSGYIIGGEVYNPVSTNFDALILKLNKQGNVLWAKNIENSSYSEINILSIQTCKDSGYVMTGYATSSTQYNFNAKLDKNGNLIWANYLLCENYMLGHSIKQAPDGGYIVAGAVGNNASINSTYLVKLTSNGSVSWLKTYNNNTANESSYANDVVITKNNFVMYLNSNGIDVLTKTDSLGNIAWSKSYFNYDSPTSTGQSTPNLCQTNDGGYAFGALTKVDSLGNIIFGKTAWLEYADLIQTKDKGFLILAGMPIPGVRLTMFSYLQDIYVSKMDSMGNGAALCYQNDPYTATLYTIIAAPGVFSVSSGGIINTLTLTVKTILISAHNTCVPPSGGIEKYNNSGNNFSIYPNPTNTTLNLQMSQFDNLKMPDVEVTNTLGEAVYHSQIATSPNYQIDVSTLPAGVYFIRVGTATQKFVKQ